MIFLLLLLIKSVNFLHTWNKLFIHAAEKAEDEKEGRLRMKSIWIKKAYIVLSAKYKNQNFANANRLAPFSYKKTKAMKGNLISPEHDRTKR